jgi:hypothetical protein
MDFILAGCSEYHFPARAWTYRYFLSGTFGDNGTGCLRCWRHCDALHGAVGMGLNEVQPILAHMCYCVDARVVIEGNNAPTSAVPSSS